MDKVIDKNKWHYTIIENNIIESESLDIYEKMIYITLKRYANLHTQEAFPGVKRLAAHAGMSDRKARSTLASLESKKLIAIERRANQTSIYTILPIPAQHSGTAQHAGGVLHEVQEGTARGADELKKDELKKVLKIKDSVHQDELFEEWWDFYDKKVGDKKKSKTRYKSFLNARGKNKVTHEEIMEGTRRYQQYLKDLKARGEFAPTVKHPYTFLNGENFKDEYEEHQSTDRPKKKYESDSVDMGEFLEGVDW